MLETIVILSAIVVMAVGRTLYLKQKKQELANLANGEYLNWSKAKRCFRAKQEYPAGTKHSLKHTIQEKSGIFATRISAKNRDSINEINENFVARRLVESKGLFDQLGLTDAQRLAIVRDEDANLINAGAGSGKTRTILTKAEYLIVHGLAKSAEILIVVYNNKIQQEIAQKSKKVDPNITVSTFHALGFGIIKKAERVRVSDMAKDDKKLEDFLSQKMRDILVNSKLLSLLIDFFARHLVEGDPERVAKNKDEYFRKIDYVGLRSMSGEKLKSHEEVQIANWLTLNGIDWEYEQDYPHNESDRQHQPDFYLPDYDVWIEHFGINEDGATASWVEKEKYIEQMNWKINEHQKHQTKLVKTYSYEAKKPGGLPDALEQKLAQYGVKKKPFSEQEVDYLIEKNFKSSSKFIKLINKFLHLAKENKLSQQLAERVVSLRDGAFLILFDLLRNSYEKKLEDANEIDFSDMIIRALEYIESGKYKSPYRYILVDEYQDITKVRLDFLLALQRQVQDARLFCVGDDWQSIYQFQGANISLITEFEKHVEVMQRTDLNKTFRYSQKINDFSSVFVTRNHAQLKKNINSSIASKEEERPIKIVYHAPKNLQKLLKKIIAWIARQSPKAKSCFVLGRYNFNKPEGWQEIKKCALEKGINIEFSTIHGSKGKEADWVVVVENKSDMNGTGFPSSVQDDPVLKMVLTQKENFPDAEERRLFYVAITRTRQGVFLLVPNGEASDFIKEIDPRPKKQPNGEFIQSEYAPFVDVVNKNESKILFCPECGGQTIRKILTDNGRFFYACSHFPSCNGRLTICITENCEAAVDLKEFDNSDKYVCECGRESTICPQCRRGILIERTGQRGAFWGCSQYGVSRCRYTNNIPCEGQVVAQKH